MGVRRFSYLSGKGDNQPILDQYDLEFDQKHKIISVDLMAININILKSRFKMDNNILNSG